MYFKIFEPLWEPDIANRRHYGHFETFFAEQHPLNMHFCHVPFSIWMWAISFFVFHSHSDILSFFNNFMKTMTTDQYDAVKI